MLDLVYLEPGGDSLDYLTGLRLNNLGWLDWQLITRSAGQVEKPKLLRALTAIRALAHDEGEYESL